MKKIIAPNATKFIYAMKGFIPFIFAVLLFASCTKEDPAAPQQPMTDQSAPSSEANRIGGGQGVSEPMISLPPIPTIPANALIFISHGSCMGNCPTYTVVITREGNVIYNGKGNVALFGEYKYKIGGNKLLQMQHVMAVNGFTELQSYYPYVPDLPQGVTALNTGTTNKVVVDYSVNVPEALSTIRSSIEAIAGVNHFVNGDFVERIWLDNDNQ